MDYLHDKAQAARFLTALAPVAREFLFLEIRADGRTRQYYTNLGGVWPQIVHTNRVGGSNWFVAINETNGAARTATEMKSVRALFIDCDTPESVNEFKSWANGADASARPSIIVGSSAGKCHAYWLVQDCPLQQFKPLQQALAEKFGSDKNVCDPSRVMRLAGTYNVKIKYAEPTLCKAVYPNNKIWAVGELTAALGIAFEGNGMSFIDDLKKAKAAPNAASDELGSGIEAGWYGALSPSHKNVVVRAACEALISGTKVFEIESDGGSNADWHRLMCALARSGASDAEGIFVEYALKAKTPDSEAKLREQFNRVDIQAAGGVMVGTLLKWAQDAGADFSEWKAIAAKTGLKASGRLPAAPSEPIKPGTYTRSEAVVLLSDRLFFDGATGDIYHIEAVGRAIPRPYQNMARLYNNILVKSESEGANKPAFPIWTASPNRPTREVIFDPQEPSGLGGVTNEPFNTWEGFIVIHEPDTTKVQNIHDMILKVICDSNREHYEYVLNCLAWLRQKTGTPLGVVLNLIGTGGMGKSVFGQLLVSKYFGAHGQVLNSRDQLGSRFNGRFDGKVVTFVEETIFQGDKGLTDQFKALVTGATVSIERKGLEARDVPNCNSFIMATNHDHAFHSDSGMRRRMFPLRVSDDKQMLGHLAPLAAKDMEAGGREAFWDEMAARDISRFVPSHFPANAEIDRQKRMSLGPVEDFLLAIADAEGVQISEYEKRPIPCTITPSDLHKAFLQHHRGQVHSTNQTKLSEMVILKLGIKLSRPRNGGGDARTRVFNFPDRRAILKVVDPASISGGQEDGVQDGMEQGTVLQMRSRISSSV